MLEIKQKHPGQPAGSWSPKPDANPICCNDATMQPDSRLIAIFILSYKGLTRIQVASLQGCNSPIPNPMGFITAVAGVSPGSVSNHTLADRQQVSKPGIELDNPLNGVKQNGGLVNVGGESIASDRPGRKCQAPYGNYCEISSL